MPSLVNSSIFCLATVRSSSIMCSQMPGWFAFLFLHVRRTVIFRTPFPRLAYLSGGSVWTGQLLMKVKSAFIRAVARLLHASAVR